MRKLLFYSTVAVILGLVLTLSPLMLLRKIETENDYRTLGDTLFPAELERLEELGGSNKQAYSYSPIIDFEVLLVSFAAASIAYVLFRRKMFSS